MEKIDLTSYVYNKLIQALIYDEKTFILMNEQLLNDYLEDPNFIIYFRDYLLKMLIAGNLEQPEVSKIQTIINWLRINYIYNSKEEKHEYYEIFNDLIISLNAHKENSDDFYLKEIDKRFDPKFIMHLNNEQFAKYKNIIKKSLGLDFYILLHSLEVTTQDEYIDEFVPMYTLNSYYFMSLNAMIKENTNILQSKELLKRIKIMLENNKINKMTNKKIKEKVFLLRQNKRYNTYFKGE
ncbi:MAG: hypothetical protein RSB71_04095 [Bacilli bacterium]